MIAMAFFFFRSSGLKVSDMIKLGTVLNFACLAVVMGSIMSYGYLMYDLGEFPEWAQEGDVGNGTDVCGYN